MSIIENPSGVGDVNATNRGSAARYNSGKVRLELLPLWMVVATTNKKNFNHSDQHIALESLAYISEFQRTHDEKYIDYAIHCLSNNWDDAANVFDYGRKKYAEWNWVKGMNWSIPIACIARHCRKMFKGELVDDESNYSHLGHILCNVVMLKCYISGFPEGNDLPPKMFKVESD